MFSELHTNRRHKITAGPNSIIPRVRQRDAECWGQEGTIGVWDGSKEGKKHYSCPEIPSSFV